MEFICDQCDFKSRDKKYLKKHLKVQHQWGRFDCDLCERSIKWSNNDLKKHKLRIHGAKEKRCTQCEYVAAMESDLTEHDRRKHQMKYQKKIECKQCPKILSSTSSMKNHMKYVHEGVKRVPKVPGSFPCNLCPKIFSFKQNMKAHEQNIHMS